VYDLISFLIGLEWGVMIGMVSMWIYTRYRLDQMKAELGDRLFTLLEKELNK